MRFADFLLMRETRSNLGNSSSAIAAHLMTTRPVDTLTRAKLVAETLERYEDAKRKNDDKTAVQLLTLLSRLDEKAADENDRADPAENVAQLSVDELHRLAGQALCTRCEAPLRDNFRLSNACDAIEVEVIS